MTPDGLYGKPQALTYESPYFHDLLQNYEKSDEVRRKPLICFVYDPFFYSICTRTSILQPVLFVSAGSTIARMYFGISEKMCNFAATRTQNIYID